MEESCQPRPYDHSPTGTVCRKTLYSISKQDESLLVSRNEVYKRYIDDGDCAALDKPLDAKGILQMSLLRS